MNFLRTYRKPLIVMAVLAFGWHVAQSITAKMGHGTLVYIGVYLVVAMAIGYEAGKSGRSSMPGKGTASRERGEPEPKSLKAARARVVELEAERDQLAAELSEERGIVQAMTEQLHPGQFN